LPIADWRLPIADIRNSKLEIRNSEKTPLRELPIDDCRLAIVDI
jgi:hypothetical protein